MNLRPSVKELTIKSISIKDAPKINTNAPAVKNTLNNGNSLFADILLHHEYLVNDYIISLFSCCLIRHYTVKSLQLLDPLV